MTALLTSTMKLTLFSGIIFGLLMAVGMTKADAFGVEKRGAGLVLFVSLQRNSMS